MLIAEWFSQKVNSPGFHGLHRHWNIAVAGDDPSIRDALEDLLRSAGLEAQLFASAQEFLRSKRPDTPSCLVLDIKMPGENGLDFQRTLAKLNIQLPIIFIIDNEYKRPLRRDHGNNLGHDACS
jgi:DNA-binding NtrC family response regulator